MPSQRRVYLHIGAPKTGTTYVQGVLWANRELLAHRGVWLPGKHPNDHFRAGFDLRGIEQNPDDPRPGWVGLWDGTAAQIRASGSEIVVLSDERLAACSPEQAHRAVESLAPAEVHVIYTVRDFGRLLSAEWQEHIKAGDTRAFADWLAHILGNPERQWFWQVHDVADVLCRWESAVPRDRLHVVTVPPPGSRPEVLWERFASVLDIAPEGLHMDVRTNSSLGAQGAELLRQVNERLPAEFPCWHREELVREVLAHQILATRQDRTPIAVPVEWSDQLGENSKQVVRHLEDEQYRVTGDLDELISARSTGEPDVSNECTDIWPETLGALLARMAEIYDQRRRLRDDLDDVREQLRVVQKRLLGAENVIREDRDLGPGARVKRTVVELGERWAPIGVALSVWRRVKTCRRRREGAT